RLADTRLRRRKAARHAARALNAVAPTRTSSDEGVASQAIRTTIALLSRDGDFDDDAWTALLEAAVAAVPGAEAGTFFVRNGDAFVVRAQTSFSDGLLGLTQTEDEARAWYGGQDWRTGRARIIRGDDVDAHSRKVNDQEGVEENRARYETFGEVTSLRANLCVPVLLGGHVVAQLNLDNLRDDDAFDEADARVAEDFAVQAAALLAARARRAR
ncbi:GAF domain-containing protein, partial [Deinococcus pimensis]|uniref:GAF domain-containing protein n=1 Tax=Deinococcus pimensis TaxID=309888 RepID=UPI0005EB7DC0